MRLTRRQALSAVGAALASNRLSRGQSHEHEKWPKPHGWVAEKFGEHKVYTQGSGSRVIVLLHELNGLSPGCISFGAELVAQRFKVYMPLLFGHFAQNNIFLGTLESCSFGGFKCNSAGSELGKQNTEPVRWLQNFVKQLAGEIGVIGMCETGGYPLAVMTKNSMVKAVIMSQPALPLPKEKQRDAGVLPDCMTAAKESGIPILAMRFKQDTISTCDRFQFLEDYFGSPQFQGCQFDGPPGFEQTVTHRLHAILTGDFGEIREHARRVAIDFLNDHVR